MEPRIQYAKTSDGVNVAYPTLGGEPPRAYMPIPPPSHACRTCYSRIAIPVYFRIPKTRFYQTNLICQLPLSAAAEGAPAARTSARVRFEDRGEQWLKGIADPQKLFAVKTRE